jgi:hydroxymethylbilane synthase
MRLKIAARQSALAKLQAFAVGDALERHHRIEIEYRFRESLGDQNLHDPLWKMPGKGVFTEDFKKDLIEGSTDLVVHSWKDLPTEMGPETEVVATLPRADSRDLLLFKKVSPASLSIEIMSSSPRRAWNLSSLLPQLLPGGIQAVSFTDVRGNVPTRIQKLLDSKSSQGLIVAKAALDRLLSVKRDEFRPTQEFLRMALEQLNWMVLPLSFNPTAAAQGALAIEIASQRDDLRQLLAPLHCSKTFRAALREREILKEFGGGCHLALGISSLELAEFSYLFVRGKSPQDEIVVKNEISGRRNPVVNISAGNCWSSSSLTKTRHPKPSQLDPKYGYIVSRAPSWPKGFRPQGPVWTAGVETWKKLALDDVWVHGTFDSLGAQDLPPVDALCPGVDWKTLTHSNHPEWNPERHLATYEIVTEGEIPVDIQYYFWKSSTDFIYAEKYAAKLGVDLSHSHHACGPGSTFLFLKKRIPSDRLHVFLNEDEWRKSL